MLGQAKSRSLPQINALISLHLVATCRFAGRLLQLVQLAFQAPILTSHRLHQIQQLQQPPGADMVLEHEPRGEYIPAGHFLVQPLNIYCQGVWQGFS